MRRTVNEMKKGKWRCPGQKGKIIYKTFNNRRRKKTLELKKKKKKKKEKT